MQEQKVSLMFLANHVVIAQSIIAIDFSDAFPEKKDRRVTMHLVNDLRIFVTDPAEIDELINIFVPKNKLPRFTGQVRIIT